MLLAYAVAAAAVIPLGQYGAAATRIAFGSCNKQYEDQSYWRTVTARRPDVWLWSGDTVYGDRVAVRWPAPEEDGTVASCMLNFLCFWGATPEGLREGYVHQLAEPAYQELLSNVSVVLGTWDDHDMGLNNGDGRYRWREESQHAFLDFLGEPQDSPRRAQKGVWGREVIPLKGAAAVSNRSAPTAVVHVLDVRSGKTPYGSWRAEDRGDYLGEAQWKWLEESLAKAARQGAAVNVVVSGIPFLRTWPPVVEVWGRFKPARRRLLETLAASGAKGLVLVSGDSHIAELNAVECGASRIYDVTSSGLTHSLGGLPWALQVLARFVLWLYPQQHLAAPTYFGRNFGELDIEVDDNGEVTVTTRIVSLEPGLEEGRTVLEQRLERLSQGYDVGPCAPLHGPPSKAAFAVRLALAVAALLVAGSCCLGLQRCLRRRLRVKEKQHAA